MPTPRSELRGRATGTTSAGGGGLVAACSVLAALIGLAPVAAAQTQPPPTSKTRPQPKPAPKPTPKPKPVPAAQPHAPPTAGARKVAITTRATLKVIHPAEVRKVLLKRAAELGGFPTLVTNTRLVLKLPPQQTEALIRTAASQGLLLERSLGREDLTARIAQLEAQRRSKRDILAKLRALLQRSGVRATLDAERSMTRLVGELEAVQGALRVARDRSRWAVCDLSFRFRKREKLNRARSPFGWINDVDLKRFLGRF